MQLLDQEVVEVALSHAVLEQAFSAQIVFSPHFDRHMDNSRISQSLALYQLVGRSRWLFGFNSNFLRMKEGDRSAGIGLQTFDHPLPAHLASRLFGRPRWIEVKSTTGTDGRFEWSRKEFEKALREGKHYELWRVYQAATATPVAKRFVNPAGLLGASRLILELGSLRAYIEDLH